MNLSKNKLNFYNNIERLLNNNVLSHAYLIEVNNYEDDYNDVLKFVKLILCNKKDKSINNIDCNECNICNLIDNSSYPDLYVVEADGSLIKKDQILQLEREFSNSSILDNKRIYIIKEAEKMNSYAANTILKFLEEPSDNIIAIILTNNRYKIIDTILSRCQILSLKSSYNIDDYSKFYDFLKKLVNKDDLFIYYDDIVNELFIIEDNKISKDKLHDFFFELSVLLINYYNYIDDNINSFDEEICNIMKDVSKEKIIKYISIIEEEIDKLKYNVNNRLWIDSIFAKFIGG